MRKVKSTVRPWFVALGLLASCSAWAVSVSPESFSMPSGESRTVKIAKVTGTLVVTNSSPAVASVTWVDASTYRISVSGKRAAFFSSAAPTSTMPAIVDDAEASDERTKATS
jgi:hypothetical protein